MTTCAFYCQLFCCKDFARLHIFTFVWGNVQSTGHYLKINPFMGIQDSIRFYLAIMNIWLYSSLSLDTFSNVISRLKNSLWSLKKFNINLVWNDFPPCFWYIPAMWHNSGHHLLTTLSQSTSHYLNTKLYVLYPPWINELTFYTHKSREPKRGSNGSHSHGIARAFSRTARDPDTQASAHTPRNTIGLRYRDQGTRLKRYRQSSDNDEICVRKAWNESLRRTAEEKGMLCTGKTDIL